MKTNIIDTMFSVIVADPYRSLENDTLLSTKKWLEEQRDLTKSYMDKLINKFELKPQFHKNSLASFPSFRKSGCYYFSSVIYGSEPTPSLYVHTRVKGEGNRIVNPAHYLTGKNDVASVRAFAVSENNKYLAFSIAHKGSDWQEIHIKSIHPDRDLEDVLQDVKFSSIEWNGNGFYYTRYAFSGANRLHGRSEKATIYYHSIGTQQHADPIIYQVENDPLAKITFTKVATGDYLVVYDAHKEHETTQILVQSLKLNGNDSGKWQTVIRSQEGSYEVLGLYNNRFLIKTTLGASRGRLLLCNPNEANDVEEFIPQYKETLADACIAGNKVICTYLADISYAGVTFDSTGKPVNSIDYPAGSSISNFTSSPFDSTAIFYCTSFFYPAAVFEYNVNSFKINKAGKTELAFDFNQFTVDKVHYRSSDGVEIPMMIAYKKGLRMNGTAPTILYGYGGNGVVMTPFFNRNFVSHLENGGVIALPCIRGGSEFGEEWHKQGARKRKQQTFDDFIAAVEYLVKEHYTTKDKLALMGGSNGGLLVAAVINQRPDICKVAIVERGVYDMLRFEKFTIGHAWQDEYGESSDSIHFNNLYQYSPLHNIRKGVTYPAIFITTADHDDRVVPLHSYKYVAQLQEHTSGTAPILLHVEKNAGHQSRSIDEDVMIYSFIYEQLGVRRQKVGLQN